MAGDLSDKGILRRSSAPIRRCPYTGAYAAYRKATQEGCHHAVIHHGVAYADGCLHTNTIEGFWSLLTLFVASDLKWCAAWLVIVQQESIHRGNLETDSESRNDTLFDGSGTQGPGNIPYTLWRSEALLQPSRLHPGQADQRALEHLSGHHGHPSGNSSAQNQQVRLITYCNKFFNFHIYLFYNFPQ